MDRKLGKRLLIFLLVAGVIAYALVRLSGRQGVARVAAVEPVRENLTASIMSNGKVEPIAPMVMRAQLDTFVEKVYAVEGQPVKRGQLIVDLNVKDAAAQLAEARSKLLRAEEDVRTAGNGGRSDEVARTGGDVAKAVADRDRLQKNHDALERLIAKQAATQEELAINDLALTKAQAEVTRLSAGKTEFDRGVKLDVARSALSVQQVKSEVAALEEKVRNGRIVATSDATLYSLPVKAGDYVKVGDLLAEMADLHQVRVRAFIDEPELGALEPNQPVKITWDALPNRSWQGRTEVIPKQVIARGTRSVGELLCAVDNSKLELLPNINVDVRIDSAQRNGVLAIPRGAVEAEGSKRFVYVVKDNPLSVAKTVLEKREIRVGIADAARYEVLSGLTASDRVALPGDLELRDGMPVKLVASNIENVVGHKDE